MFSWRLFSTTLFACLLSGLVACDRNETTTTSLDYQSQPRFERPVYRLAIHPLHNPQKLFEVFQPLVDHFNAQQTDITIELEASTDYQAFEAKYQKQAPEILLPNPWQALQAMQHGYHVIASVGSAQDFKGIFIRRKDSAIRHPSDLKGKIISYPSHTALAACVMPQYFLHQHGIDVRKDVTNSYVGSQESSIMNAYLKQSAVAATWPPPWRAFIKQHPEKAAELEVIWETDSLINNAFMIRQDVTPHIRDTLQHILMSLPLTHQGQQLLAKADIAQFYPATDADYDTVAEFVSTFEKTVRPVALP